MQGVESCSFIQYFSLCHVCEGGVTGVWGMTIASLGDKVEECFLCQAGSRASRMMLQGAEWKCSNYEESCWRLLLGS